MSYRLLIFDLDGTLADTSYGIINSHKYTNVQMGREEPTDKEMEGIIGGPLLETYINRFGYTEEQARRAVQIYRERYAKYGIHEVQQYEGMTDTLKELKHRGYYLGVATLKAERFAKEIINDLGMSEIFDVIHGVDENDTLSKSDLIRLCMKDLQCDGDECILIGDSIHDKHGAEQAGINFLPVIYGFGFSEHDEELGIRKVNCPKNILDLI